MERYPFKMKDMESGVVTDASIIINETDRRKFTVVFLPPNAETDWNYWGNYHLNRTMNYETGEMEQKYPPFFTLHLCKGDYYDHITYLPAWEETIIDDQPVRSLVCKIPPASCTTKESPPWRAIVLLILAIIVYIIFLVLIYYLILHR